MQNSRRRAINTAAGVAGIRETGRWEQKQRSEAARPDNLPGRLFAELFHLIQQDRVPVVRAISVSGASQRICDEASWGFHQHRLGILRFLQ